MMLIENFEGKFPTWLAPEQVRVLPISDANLGYAHRVKNQLSEAGFRVDVDGRDGTIENKIRTAHEDRVPYQVILGDDEEDAGDISVRDRKERQSYDVETDAFIEHLHDEIGEKRIEPDFLD